MSAVRGLAAVRALPGTGPVTVVRDRPWLVSDALVAERLRAHPVLPLRDVALQRGARAVAFALGLLALPDAGPASIAAVDLVLDAERLAGRVAMAPSAIEEAFRALWVADVLEHGASPGTARFAESLVPETPLAYALRWGVLAERLLDRSGEGSLAAVVLFRLVLDRLSHPQAPVALPASLVLEQLGLSEDQTRRGMKALLQRGLLAERAQAGRAKQYVLGADALVGQPAAPVAAPPVPAAAGLVPVAPVASAATPRGDESAWGAVAPGAVAPGAAGAAGAAGPILEFAGQRIELPAQAELSVAVPGTRVAGMRLDPATGRLVVVLEPAG